MKLSKLSKGVGKVLANFNKLKIPKTHHLNMSERDFLTGNPNECGTVLCHGGWYAVAKGLHLQEKQRPNYKMDYADGAEAMAKDMGFADMDYMIVFFDQHHDLWGNRLAHYMFNSPAAFMCKGRTKAYTLHDIIDHWRQVKARIDKKEAENAKI